MSKQTKKVKFTRKISKALTSFFIIIIFLFPIVVTGKWIADAAYKNDHRSLYSTQLKYNIRPVDQNEEDLDPFNEPLITITFDDGWETVYSAGLPIMEEYGIKTTQYILADEFKNQAYMSVEQINSLKKYGHEIASHSLTHPDLTKASDKELEDQVVDSKNILEKAIKSPVFDFASPLGAYDDRTINIIKQSYRSQRNTAADVKSVDDKDVNIKSSFNRYNIIAFTVRQSTTVSDIANMVEYAKANNGWVVLNYHQVEDSSSQYSITKQAFEEQMKYLFNEKIRSAPLGLVLDAIQERKAAKW